MVLGNEFIFTSESEITAGEMVSWFPSYDNGPYFVYHLWIVENLFQKPMAG